MPHYLVPVVMSGHLLVEADTKLEAVTTAYQLRHSKIAVAPDPVQPSELPVVTFGAMNETAVGLWPAIKMDGIARKGHVKEVK